MGTDNLRGGSHPWDIRVALEGGCPDGTVGHGSLEGRLLRLGVEGLRERCTQAVDCPALPGSLQLV